MGGQSAEREISLKTGNAICQALRRQGYPVTPIDVDSTLPWQLRKKRVEVAFIALHGPGGEDGTVQGLLEVLGIPYTGSTLKASAVAMDKALTRSLCHAHNIPVPKGTALHDEYPQGVPPCGLKWPVVVKPASQGSTIGVSIVRQRSKWRAALRQAYQYGSVAIVENFIPGREITVSVLDGKALPSVEIETPSGFYDFGAKYIKSETRYLCPAPLSVKTKKRLETLAIQVYRLMDCAGAARVDFRVTLRGMPFLLEINTIPGMTERSLLPIAAAQVNLTYDALVEKILECAIRDHRKRGGNVPLFGKSKVLR